MDELCPGCGKVIRRGQYVVADTDGDNWHYLCADWNRLKFPLKVA
jgi:hypothetical protein